jgi:putative SOS response-associated peptidase YedK
MPLILKPDAFDSWLDPNIQDVNQLNNIMQDQHVREMKSYPISKFVNRVQNNSKKCIEPLPAS